MGIRVAQLSRLAAGGVPAEAGRGAQDLGVAATFTMRPEGRICCWSAGAARLFGQPAQQILGRPLRDLLHPGSRDVLAGALTAITAGAAWGGGPGPPPPPTLTPTPTLSAPRLPQPQPATPGGPPWGG